MNRQELVSVVIASYNMAQFLPMDVMSVLDQTYPNLEVHIVDDGSTDSTKEVMSRFLDDPRVKYHYQPNKGQAGAKNSGIRESQGEHIAFLDADDMWMSRKLEKQLPLFDDGGSIGLIYSREININEKAETVPTGKHTFYRGKITGRLLEANSAIQ